MNLALLMFTAYAAQPVGHLDAATATWVGGWAYDPDHPSSRIAVHVYVDGQLAAAGDTAGVRPDVNAAFGITGEHGFTIPVDVAAFGAGQHAVVAYAIDPDGEGNPGIDGSPAYVTTTCTPSCGGRTCGDDGCGGTCGSCASGQWCDAGACAGDPQGSLDAAGPGLIGGWARDPDHDGPIDVHIYVDGQLMKVARADQSRSDVGAHAFNWVPQPFGPGSHEVVAYAIGVDAGGAPDGHNPSLEHTPARFTGSCDGLQADAYGWCTSLAPYWTSRQADTTYVGNDSVRVGVDRSYGGTIFQLYGPGWDRNLVLEHGGGAVQLSIWGYDPVGTVGWFADETCDPTGYPTPEACAARHTSCSAWAHPQGAHVSNCQTTSPCGGWTAGAPWNPIQAQGPQCGWDSPLNDVNAAGWQGDAYYTRLDAPFHFTSTQPAVPMPMEQWVTPHWGYVEIRYRLSYTGPYTWTPHPQEIPAFFTAPGVNERFYYYGGDAPFTGGSVVEQVGGSQRFVRYANRTTYGHGDSYDGYAREGWWGACDASGQRCVTLASFSPLINEVALQSNQSGGSGYITALGYFGVHPGMSLEWTIYVFPKRYDQVSGDRTVREHIYALAPADFVSGACVPRCDGATCGDDGCGGTCGACGGTQACELGRCACHEPCSDCLGHVADADSDGVCDPADACLGDDASGDADGDGVCDDSDVCLGADPAGDADGDGVCDDRDVCWGEDPTGDADGDGVCGDLDLCWGDDAAGDADSDGVCDDADLCWGGDATGDRDADGVCDDSDACLGDDAAGDDDGDAVCDDRDACLGDDAAGDGDGDGVCDDLDLCLGDDATGDADADGLCRDVDPCFGDDRSGDTDGDGVCEDRDVHLQVGALRAGQPLNLRVTNAPPGWTAWFLVAPRAGRACHPTLTHVMGGPLCADLASPSQLGQARVGANGVATLTATAPAALPAGARVMFQAIAGDGRVGNSTEVVVAP